MKRRSNTLPGMLAGACLAAAFLVTLPNAAAQIPVIGIPAVPPAVTTAAKEFIANMPDLAGTVVTGYQPLYVPRKSQIVFYEAKLVSVFPAKPKGSLIMKLDGKVIQFTTEGLSRYEQLKLKTGNVPFRMIRMTGSYFAAEDFAGKRIAEIGELPRLRVHHSLPQLVTAPTVFFDSLSGAPRPTAINPDIRIYASREAAYEDYVANYLNYFINIPKKPQTSFPMRWKEEIPATETGTGSGGDGRRIFTAVGIKPVRWKQLKADDPRNDRDYKTGCGATAILNLMAWWDVNWTSTIMPGPTLPSGFLVLRNDYDTDLKAAMTKDVRNRLGTIESPFSPGQGATLPWDMEHGFEKFKGNNHNQWIDYTESYDLTFGGDPDAAEIAKVAIKKFGKPAIIGYWDDVHYDLAYKYYAEGVHEFFFIDKDDMSGEWVLGDDLFYGAAVWDIGPAWNKVRNHSFEVGGRNWHKAGNGHVELKENLARRGTGHFLMGSNSGGTHRLWQTLILPGDNTSVHVSAWIKATVGATVKVRFRPGFENAVGPVIAEKAFTPAVNQWMKVDFNFPKMPPIILLEFAVSGDAGESAWMRVDDVYVSASVPGSSNIPPHEPCVPGKRGQDGYDEGCEVGE